MVIGLRNHSSLGKVYFWFFYNCLCDLRPFSFWSCISVTVRSPSSILPLKCQWDLSVKVKDEGCPIIRRFKGSDSHTGLRMEAVGSWMR